MYTLQLIRVIGVYVKMDTRETVDAITILFKELDRMKILGHGKNRKAFLKMSKKPREKDIQHNFGLLRIRAWRNLAFETIGGKGAYIFLDMVYEVSEKGKQWEIGCWKKLDIWQAYTRSPRWTPVADDQEPEPVEQSGTEDDPENGMGPQKKDPPPSEI